MAVEAPFAVIEPGAAISVELAAFAAPATKSTVVAEIAEPFSVPLRCAVPAEVPEVRVAV